MRASTGSFVNFSRRASFHPFAKFARLIDTAAFGKKICSELEITAKRKRGFTCGIERYRERQEVPTKFFTLIAMKYARSQSICSQQQGGFSWLEIFKNILQVQCVVVVFRSGTATKNKYLNKYVYVLCSSTSFSVLFTCATFVGAQLWAFYSFFFLLFLKMLKRHRFCKKRISLTMLCCISSIQKTIGL